MSKKPCKYAQGIEGEWECTAYSKIDCPYQDVDYNYLDHTTGHKEVNVVGCAKMDKE